MKTIIYLLTGMMFFSACNNTKKQQEVQQTQQADAEILKSLEEQLQKAENLLEQIELKKQITDIKFKDASLEEKEVLFEELQTYINETLMDITNKEPYVGNYYDHRKYDGDNVVVSQEAIKIEKTYADAGFVFVEGAEGGVFLATKPDYYKKYAKQLPPYYMELLNLLEDSEIAADGGVIVTWEELGELLARYEDFIEKYPQALERFDIISINYDAFQEFYIAGLDNTPTTDNAQRLYPDVKAEWERFSKKYPKSLTTQMIKMALETKNRTLWIKKMEEIRGKQ